MAKEFLVGYTGFVGSNLASTHHFSGLFNRKNIADAFDGHPDLLVYSGVPAEMFLANQDPEADMEIIRQAEENIRRVDPQQLVLISTIAVYPDTHGADEDTSIEENRLTPYGANRYTLERWVEAHFEQHLIVRLPALYGIHLKKNFLFDYIHRIPSMLTEAKLEALSKDAPTLREFYIPKGNGFYQCRPLTAVENQFLRNQFEALGFSALNFTDSRSQYQFFDLRNLWGFIEIALENHIHRLNITVPPIQAGELYQELCGKPFRNELGRPPFDYDLRSKHAALFGGSDGYLIGREEMLQGIRDFITLQEGERP